MREIQLTQGYVALVDDEDYEDVARFKWFAHIAKNTVYASRTIAHNPKRGLLMHRYLLGVSGFVDHEDGNGLNNQRYNLRECTTAQNSMNRRKMPGTSSRFKGVSWDREQSKWRSGLRLNGKNINIGRFTNEEDAARAYDQAALRYFGDFALTNFSLEETKAA